MGLVSPIALTLLWVVPLIGALIAALTPSGGQAPQRFGLGFSVGTAVLCLIIGGRFHADGGSQFAESIDWIAPLGAHYAVSIDGLSLVLILLTVGLTPLVILASWRDTYRASFIAWILALESFALLVFLADDLLLFYVAFEATLIPAFFLVGGWGKRGRARAAMKFLIFQLAGGLVLLAGVVALWVYSAEAGAGVGGPSLMISDLAALELPVTAERWIFVAFFIAFAVKAPLFPLHTWLADTTEHATPPTSVLLVCVLDKIGTYAMLRFCLGIFPGASDWATPVVVAMALISIVYGAFLAIGQDNLLRLIGLTSLSHFGFITLGIFVISANGSSAATMYMFSHGIATGALFFAAGFIERRYGTVSISALGGLEAKTPVLAGFFLIAGLATLGLPGLAQFPAEVVVIVNAFGDHWWVGAIALTGLVLAAVYVLWAYQRIFTGAGTPTDADGVSRIEPKASNGLKAGADATPREVVVLGVLTAGLVFYGFAPTLMLDLVNPTIEAIIEAGTR